MVKFLAVVLIIALFVKNPILAIIVAALVVAGAVWLSKVNEEEKDVDRKVWKKNDAVYISYNCTRIPPNFRNIHAKDAVEGIITCGFCEQCKSIDGGSQCKRYDVRYFGVGSVAETVCDDFKFDWS